MPKSKPPYPEAFRREAIELVRASRKSIAQVARELGTSSETLRLWVRQAEIDAGRGQPGELTTSEREDLARLRRQVRTLELEREILKKAAAFFAKETL
jgi:transposase-like protein